MAAKYQTSIAVVCLFAVLSLLAGQISSNAIRSPFPGLLSKSCLSNMTVCDTPMPAYFSSPELLSGLQVSYLPNGRISNVTFTEEVAVNVCRAIKKQVSCLENKARLCINMSYVGVDRYQASERIVYLFAVCDHSDFYANVMILKDCFLALYNNPQSMNALESCYEEVKQHTMEYVRQYVGSQEVIRQKLTSGEYIREIGRLTDKMMTCTTPIFATCSPRAKILTQNVFDAAQYMNAPLAILHMSTIGGVLV